MIGIRKQLATKKTAYISSSIMCGGTDWLRLGEGTGLVQMPLELRRGGEACLKSSLCLFPPCLTRFGAELCIWNWSLPQFVPRFSHLIGSHAAGHQVRKGFANQGPRLSDHITAENATPTPHWLNGYTPRLRVLTRVGEGRQMMVFRQRCRECKRGLLRDI